MALSLAPHQRRAVVVRVARPSAGDDVALVACDALGLRAAIARGQARLSGCGQELLDRRARPAVVQVGPVAEPGHARDLLGRRRQLGRDAVDALPGLAVEREERLRLVAP